MVKRNEQSQDETHYCTRCGISFLWSIEDKHHNSTLDPTSAQQCPGCRHLLPPPTRDRGLVKWYQRQKGYGFITRYQQPDIYVHRSAIRQGRLVPESLVEFSIGSNQQGPVAQEVVVLETE